MLRYSSFTAHLVWLVIALVPSIGFGQFGGGSSEPSVAATGSVTVKLKPATVRMVIQLPGKGKTIEEALAQLTDRRDAALLQLAKLGAAKDAIVVADPIAGDEKADEQRRQMQRMMVQMRAQGRRVPAKPPVQAIAVQSTLTAEWPLTAKTPEMLLTFTRKLEDAVRAADLGGTNQPQELSPEEQEMAEEMESTMGYSMGDEEIKPGEPQFLYVARISDEQRQKALSEAFTKAKGEAQRLAAAAGAQLGNLISLSSMANPMNDVSGSNYRNYAQMMLFQQLANEGPVENEVTGAQPGLVSFQFVVNAEFQLLPPR